jgi:hypothetical protein
VVEARRQRSSRYLEAQGFNDRMKSGFGYFITPDQLEKRPLITVNDLARRIPLAIRAFENGGGGTSLYINKGPGRSCTPVAYVDGARVATNPLSPGFVLEEVVHVDDIEAVEVYTRGSSAPSSIRAWQRSVARVKTAFAECC